MAGAAPSQQVGQQPGTGGTGEPPWFEGLPDDLKKNATINRYKTVEEAARALDHATKRLGVPADQLIRLPTDPADEKAYGEIYDKLGRPKTADDYKIDLGQGADENDLKIAKEFAPIAHKAGLTSAQMDAALQFIAAKGVESLQAREAAKLEAKTALETDLKKELGAAYPTRVAELGRLVKETFGQEGVDAFMDKELGNSPVLVKGMLKLLDRMAEGAGPPGGSGRASASAELTPAQAEAALNVLKTDPAKRTALTDKAHPMHKTVLAERDRLAALADGRTPTAA